MSNNPIALNPNALPIDFYYGDALEIARKIIGYKLITNINEQMTGGAIIETEVYKGKIDRASHAFPNKKTKRTSAIFDKGGITYIYLIYGMYYNLNLVTGEKDEPDCILIRSIIPEIGIEVMKERRRTDDIHNLTSGPGKLCQALGINKDLYGEPLTSNKIWIEKSENNINENDIISAKRVGIDYAGEDKDLLWRFYLKDCDFVSRK